ncbi:MAG: sulfatase-like hydrolase/transferase [Rubrivivax sp.]|jgi:arylsulfatase A-like enzyme|nr:sulfatase-like hydrolase/transferase [Rubrivivax sp.]
MDLNHIVFIVMDSCRWDSFQAAATPNIDRLGVAQRRYAYASWTAPSHHAFAMGLMPHTSPRDVFASEVYKDEYAQWRERTGHGGIEFKAFLPDLSLPKVLRTLGYRTVARVSMPVLNQSTLISRDFDDYKLMPTHNEFHRMVDEMEFPDGEPHYYFLNLGETHYPYMLDGSRLPRISGVHGALKAMDDPAVATSNPTGFDPGQMEMLRLQQIKCVEYLDGQIGRLMAATPPNTHFIVTADHGELFGEEGYFGHGPIMHEKCFEVPFVEGRLG